ncbi:uncharacterized protein LOC127877907 [Dreissena polymorpha]|uniref:B box-type domain-containing protein n=1 Tax=Dreissena polymorpha TaxID=45954 RepID=A0A9D4KHC5_DREPO|nr:uncharacterized protein LOC127877907 [Dreissena polymorpha]XP_052280187.1 uncharacterized protein LOC127877907 [Dreissena polymorpha]XP_052280188.1 uncharacterized protein LOC127877907 [Dreissena polymorpha]KAH3839523.1 hypothetical protein DPMN_112954 [Dreissena polymorpha]
MDVWNDDMEAKQPVEITCLACGQEGTPTKATNYCVECESPYCETCLKTHSRFPSMRTHTVLNETDRNKWNAKMSNKITSMCSIHTGKPVDMFCKDHDQVACSACIAVYHRSCCSVKYVPNISTGTREGKEYRDVIHSLKSFLDSLTKSKSSRHAVLCQKQLDHEAMVKQIDYHKDCLLQHINVLAEKSKATLRLQLSKTQKDIGHEIGKIESLIAEQSAVLKKLINDANEAQLFIEMKKTKFRQKHIISSSVDILKPPIVSFSVCFVDANLLSCSAIAKIQTSKVAKTGLVNKINVKMRTDRSVPDIVGILTMNSGNILVLDNSNKKLKLLDYMFNLTHDLLLTDYVTGLTGISDTKVAVSVKNLKKIHIIEVSPVLTIKESFSTEQVCHGICFDSQNDDLYVCCGGNTFNENTPGRVTVFSTKGVMKREMPINHGKTLSSTPVNVTFSYKSKCLYVCDKGYGIIALSADGRTLWAFTELAEPWGLYLLPDEELLICGPSSKKVLRLIHNGKHVEIIQTYDDVIHTPSSLFYDQKSSRLFIGQYDNNILQYPLTFVD